MPKSIGDFIYKDLQNTEECKEKYRKFINKEIISLSHKFIKKNSPKIFVGSDGTFSSEVGYKKIDDQYIK